MNLTVDKDSLHTECIFPQFFSTLSNVVPYQPVVYHQAVPQQLLNSALHRTSPYLVPHFNSQQFQPTFYRSETEKLEDMIQQESRRSHRLTFDPNLRWLAAMHTKDQNAYADDGYKHNKQCNMHSWMSNTRPTGKFNIFIILKGPIGIP